MKKFIFILFLLTISLCTVRAESLGRVSIDTLSDSQIRPWMTSLYAYGFWGTNGDTALTTAANGGVTKDVFYSSMSLGLSAEFRRRGRKLTYIALLTDIGYERGVYSPNKAGSFTEGLTSHWLTIDVAPAFELGFQLWLIAGFKSKFLLSSNYKCSPDFCYAGIPTSCFNKAVTCWFAGAEMNLNYVKLNVRAGTYITPMLNLSRLSYYNGAATRHLSSMLYLEVGLRVRIFTNKEKYSYNSLDFD